MTAAGTELDGQTDVLEALDWHPVIPCEYPEEHGRKRAVWRVTFPCCGHVCLGCQTCRANWITHTANCPGCRNPKETCATCDWCKTPVKHEQAIWEPLT